MSRPKEELSIKKPCAEVSFLKGDSVRRKSL